MTRKHNGDYNNFLTWRSGVAEVGIFMSNHGQTPAHDVRFIGGVTVLSNERVEERIVDLLNQPWDETGDGAKRLVDPRIGGSLPSFYLLRSTNKYTTMPHGHRVYAYGKVEYKDIFDKTHTTTFCFINDRKFGIATGGDWKPMPFLNVTTDGDDSIAAVVETLQKQLD